MSEPLETRYDRAAEAIAGADALLIGAGAGMGVDSGLPDFRGDEGFWRAYPVFRRLRRPFMEVATPATFASDPHLAWGFYGHRLQRYRATEPHAGFALLRAIAERVPLGCFVVTSNVDGHFQRAGFDPERVLEVHGSIHWLQSTGRRSEAVWSARHLVPVVDELHCRAAGPLPRGPDGALARPNVLMFRDRDWNPLRTGLQLARYAAWWRQARTGRVVAIELGAGTAIPTVRRECALRASVLIRVNPHEAAVPPGHIGLPAGALEALRELAARLG